MSLEPGQLLEEFHSFKVKNHVRQWHYKANAFIRIAIIVARGKQHQVSKVVITSSCNRCNSTGVQEQQGGIRTSRKVRGKARRRRNCLNNLLWAENEGLRMVGI